MSVKYQILLRVCDKVESVHNASRPFDLTKLQTIKLCFFSIYKSIQNYEHKITIIGDQISDELIDFFEFFDNVFVLNELNSLPYLFSKNLSCLDCILSSL